MTLIYKPIQRKNDAQKARQKWMESTRYLENERYSKKHKDNDNVKHKKDHKD